MLKELLKRAVEMGADRIEIECEDGARLVSVFWGPAGVSIASLGAAQWDAVYEQMKEMKKKRRIVLDSTSHRLAFSKHNSFGEWVFEIRIQEVK